VGNTTTVEMYYRVFKDFSSVNSPLDSGTVIVNPQQNTPETNLTLDLNTGNNNNFIVYLRMKDKITKSVFENYYFLNNKNPNQPYNFLVTDSASNKVIFTSFSNSTIKIKHNSKDTLFVFVYKTKNLLPPPPFSTKQYIFDFPPPKPDSIFFIENNGYITPTMGKTYLVKADTQLQGGKIITNFNKNFPEIKTPYQMLLPIRYLTNKTEFDNYLHYKNKKQAIDDFWLNCGKNKYTAAEMIKVYYNRVVLANIMFSTFKPGWQTDRGMIYIIFGPPKYVYKSQNSEKWIYSLSGNAPLQFVFRKYKNPYCENEFVLNRLLDYKPVWYQAVQTWRSGKIYSVAN
jgi:GWxTD domain-containing protein